MAANYLTPPATSVDVERLFSTGTAGDILTPERNRLCPETAEKVLFLRENLPIVGFEYKVKLIRRCLKWFKLRWHSTVQKMKSMDF